MMTNVVDCDAAQLTVGMPLRVVYQRLTGDVTVPMFTAA